MTLLARLGAFLGRLWGRGGRPTPPPSVRWRDAPPIPTGWRALDADGHLLGRELTREELGEPPPRRDEPAPSWLHHRRRRDG